MKYIIGTLLICLAFSQVLTLTPEEWGRFKKELARMGVSVHSGEQARTIWSLDTEEELKVHKLTEGRFKITRRCICCDSAHFGLSYAVPRLRKVNNNPPWWS